jgi:hypothetical protein
MNYLPVRLGLAYQLYRHKMNIISKKIITALYHTKEGLVNAI